MYKMIHAFIVATPLLAVAACMTGDGTSSTGDDQDAQSASPDEPGAVEQASDTRTFAWAAEAVDPARDVSPDACTRLKSFNDSSCPSGFVCLWQDKNLAKFGVAESDGCTILDMRNVKCQITANGVTVNFPRSKGNGTFNDEMSSWSNNTSHQSCWFFNASFGGKAVLMSAQGTHRNVEADNNDQASSLRPASEGC